MHSLSKINTLKSEISRLK